jgi:hypothetical protein
MLHNNNNMDDVENTEEYNIVGMGNMTIIDTDCDDVNDNDNDNTSEISSLNSDDEVPQSIFNPIDLYKHTYDRNLNGIKCVVESSTQIPNEIFMATFCMASEDSNYDILNYLINVVPLNKNNCYKMLNILCKSTTTATTIEVVNIMKKIYLKDPSLNLSNNDNFLFNTACSNGNLDIVQWLFSILVYKENIEDENELNVINNTIINKSFDLALSNNYINILIWIYEKYPQLINTVDAFENACLKGHLNISEWLLNDLNVGINNIGFENACACGRLNVIKLIYFNKLNSQLTDDQLTNGAHSACKYGHIIVFRWIYIIAPFICTSSKMEICFTIACLCGNLQIAKWIINIVNPDLDDWLFDGYVFQIACLNNHLNVVKWLITICSHSINQINNTFQLVCGAGHYEIASLLYKVYLYIDLFDNDHASFKNACQGGNLRIAEWIESLIPSVYIIKQSIIQIPVAIIPKWNILFEIIPFQRKFEIRQCPMPTSFEDNECPICYTPFANIMTDCNHKYCKDCVNTYLDSKYSRVTRNRNNLHESFESCPMCRATTHFRMIEYTF